MKYFQRLRAASEQQKREREQAKIQAEIDKAIKKRTAEEFAKTMPSKGGGAGCLWALIVLVAICFGGWLWLSPKAWYEVEYQVSADHIFIDPKPHDCEFLKAPIGNKYCHFEKIVTVAPEGSDNPTDVYVTWEKVEDQ